MKKAIVLSALLAAGLVLPAALADDGAALPEGFKGFRGLLKGTIVSTGEGQFALKVAEVVKALNENKATKPEAAVGKELTVQVKAERLLGALKERKAGEVVVAGVWNNEGNALVAIEQIRRAEAGALAASPAPGAGNDEAARLRARISELEKTVAALKAENEALRKQLRAPKGD